jgi:hypothetical protein
VFALQPSVAFGQMVTTIKALAMPVQNTVFENNHRGLKCFTDSWQQKKQPSTT